MRSFSSLSEHGGVKNPAAWASCTCVHNHVQSSSKVVITNPETNPWHYFMYLYILMYEYSPLSHLKIVILLFLGLYASIASGFGPGSQGVFSRGYRTTELKISASNGESQIDWNSFFLPIASHVIPRGGLDVPSEKPKSFEESGLVGTLEGFPAVFVALSLHQDLYGHVSVDRNWEVPAEAPWPSSLWGQRLLDVVVSTDWSEEMKIQTSDASFPSRAVGYEHSVLPVHRAASASTVASSSKMKDFSGEIDSRPAEVLECLHLFKQTFGHVNVRRNWRVPAAHPWPVKMHNVLLSGSVSRLRITALRTGDVNTVQRLAVLGILPGKVGDSDQVLALEVTVRALERYSALYGHMLVPQTFVVPVDDPSWPEETWGIPLGQRCKKIQSKELFGDPTSVRRLRKAGFIWGARLRRTSWATVRRALEIYKTIHGHTCVPFAYVVPASSTKGSANQSFAGDQDCEARVHTCEEWPSNMHGMRLGARVSDIRAGRVFSQHRAELDALGFVWDAKLLSFERLYRALALYRKAYGHVIVPPTFIYPSPPAGGEKLTLTRTSLKVSPSSSNLVRVGYDSMSSTMGRSALGRRQGDAFANLPAELHGFPLGQRVRDIRAKAAVGGLRSSQVDRLDTLGFPWGTTTRNVVQDCTRGGQEEVVHEGKVPRSSAFEGMNRTLDDCIEHVKGDTLAIDPVRLSLPPSPVNRQPRDTRGFDEVLLALTVYRNQFGNVLVPSRWMVPSELPWPQNTWGLALGRRVSSIRHGKAYTGVKGGMLLGEREAALSRLGFVWDVQRDPRGFAHVYQALVLYKQLHGHLVIPRSFVVPTAAASDTLWPRGLWGMSLGRTLYDIRRGAAYTKPKHIKLLVELGAVEAHHDASPIVE